MSRARRGVGGLSRHAAWLAACAVIAPPLHAGAAQSAATMWALNCRGCHTPPPGFRPALPPGVGQFAQTEGGRIFFIGMPAGGKPLSDDDDTRLRREILSWKASCHPILQGAPTVRYSGQPFVR